MVLRLAQNLIVNLSIDNHNGVRGQTEILRKFPGHALRLLAGQPPRVNLRTLALPRSFIDLRRLCDKGYPRLPQQSLPSRRGGSKNEDRVFHRLGPFEIWQLS